MRTPSPSAALVVLLAVCAQAQTVDFDRGSGLASSLELPHGYRVQGNYVQVCETFTLDAGRSSTALKLVSRRYADETVEEPTEGYPAMRIVRHETGRFTTDVEVSRATIGLLPWEKETLQACATGPELALRVLSAANVYRTVSELTPTNASAQRASYDFTAVRKLPMDPDPQGISVRALDRAGYRFEASDKWARYYAGEQVRFTARVFEQVTSYPDAQYWDQTPTVYRRELAQASLTLAASTDYALAFPLEEAAGPDRYVSVSFARLGKVSTDKEVEAAVFPLVP